MLLSANPLSHHLVCMCARSCSCLFDEDHRTKLSVVRMCAVHLSLQQGHPDGEIPEVRLLADHTEQGTLGYLGPECYRKYHLTAKSDVYSFDVVLLELVTSRKTIEFARGQDNVNLAIYVDGMAKEGRAMEVVDPSLPKWSADASLIARATSGFGFESSSTTFDSSSMANCSTSSPAPLLRNAMSARSHHRELENGGKEAMANNNVVEVATEAESIYKVVYLALSDRQREQPPMKVAEELQCSLQALEATLGYKSGFQTALDNGLNGVSTISLSTEEGYEGSSGFMSSTSTITSNPNPTHATISNQH
ncbi:hypothetical protein L7F22_007803 [Adiantum nelumboides]|nr:hypothetical protein [Adiantum nelumboides]